MVADCLGAGAGGEVPQLDFAVAAAGGKGGAVGVDGHRQHPRLMACKGRGCGVVGWGGRVGWEVMALIPVATTLIPYGLPPSIPLGSLPAPPWAASQLLRGKPPPFPSLTREGLYQGAVLHIVQVGVHVIAGGDELLGVCRERAIQGQAGRQEAGGWMGGWHIIQVECK